MAKHKGWIKLWRKIQDDWKWENPYHLKAWLWLLLNAEWEENNGLKPGQLLSTTRQIAKASGMSQSSATRFLERCVQEGDIAWDKAKLAHNFGDSKGDS